ncbi:MAG TPA: hypothetical protein VNW71_07945 [Thermoanaerobaculia bacterium]|nr:hypothetical protein [Thermoanaerobaculia bacterium]
MPEHIWTVLCSRSVIDKDTNQVSLFDVVESVTAKLLQPLPPAPKVGLLAFRSELVTLWKRSSDDEKVVTFKSEIITPDGREVATSTMEAEFTQPRLRINFKAEALPIVGSGTYLFKVYAQVGDDCVTGSIPLEVNLILADEAEDKTEAPARPAKRRANVKRRR